MKKNITLLLFLMFSLCGYTQTIAYPVPDMQNCDYAIDLSGQIPIVLGNQSPPQFSVEFYESLDDAEAQLNAIQNINSFSYPQWPATITIYIRVANNQDSTYAITSFQITSIYMEMTNTTDIKCNYVPLPNLTFGHFYTEPGGQGTQLPPGHYVITPGHTFYAYINIGDCVLEQSIYIGENDFTYGFELPLPTPLIACDNDGDGFAVFDLTSKVSEIIDDYELSFNQVMFFNTYEQAALGVQGGGIYIEDPQNYINTTSYQETIYVWTHLDEETCPNITALQLDALPCSENPLTGTVTYDINSNGCTGNDVLAANIEVKLNINGAYNISTYTNNEGQYSFINIPQGENTYTVEAVLPGNFTPVEPITQTIDLGEEMFSFDFCIQGDILNDAAVYIVPVNNARPGFSAQYKLLLVNEGNFTLNGLATLQFDNTKVSFISATQDVVVSGNTLSMNYSNLLPFQTRAVSLEFLVMTPPTVDSGTILSYAAQIGTTENDEAPDNNTFIYDQIAVNSLDPNDITCREGLYITEEQADEYLHYTIRFQNVGDAEAIFVKIENTLDEKLDADTFMPMAASHDYRIEKSGSDVKFIFDNINLPGDDNEPESHGYVAYKIKPKANVVLGDTFEATASIFFDFNEAIITNTAETTIQNIAGVEEVLANAFVVYPSPASHTVNIQVNDISTTTVDVAIVNVLGKTVVSNTLQIQGNTSALDISSLNSGIYFITISSEGKSVTKKLVVK